MVTDLLAGVLLIIVWMLAALGFVAAMLGLALLLAEWGEAWRRRRQRTSAAASEVERIASETNATLTRMQAAFWQARQQLRDEANRHGQ